MPTHSLVSASWRLLVPHFALSPIGSQASAHAPCPISHRASFSRLTIRQALKVDLFFEKAQKKANFQNPKKEPPAVGVMFARKDPNSQRQKHTPKAQKQLLSWFLTAPTPPRWATNLNLYPFSSNDFFRLATLREKWPIKKNQRRKYYGGIMPVLGIGSIKLTNAQCNSQETDAKT